MTKLIYEMMAWIIEKVAAVTATAIVIAVVIIALLFGAYNVAAAVLFGALILAAIIRWF
jgi:hypothetical protein